MKSKTLKTILCTAATSLIFLYASGAFATNIDISSAYLQYRVYDADSRDDRFQGWINVQDDGAPLPQDSLTQISLRDELGASVELRRTNYWSASYYWGSWDEKSQSFEYSEPYEYAGYSIYFPSDTQLAAGQYSYTARTDNDETIERDVYFPGKEELPTIAQESVRYQWEEDQSLTLSWDTPVEDYDGLRLGFVDAKSYKDLLIVRVPATMDKVNIPSDMIAKMQDLQASTSMLCTIQTRKNTKSGMNYARGITAVEIPLSDPNLEVKANGNDDLLKIAPSDPFKLTISMSPQRAVPQSSDWWIVAQTASGTWKSFVIQEDSYGWQEGLSRCIKLPMFDLSTFEIPSPTLEQGQNFIFFVLDDNADGNIDVTWGDYIQVNIE